MNLLGPLYPRQPLANAARPRKAEPAPLQTPSNQLEQPPLLQAQQQRGSVAQASTHPAGSSTAAAATREELGKQGHLQQPELHGSKHAVVPVQPRKKRGRKPKTQDGANAAMRAQAAQEPLPATAAAVLDHSAVSSISASMGTDAEGTECATEGSLTSSKQANLARGAMELPIITLPPPSQELDGTPPMLLESKLIQPLLSLIPGLAKKFPDWAQLLTLLC